MDETFVKIIGILAPLFMITAITAMFVFYKTMMLLLKPKGEPCDTHQMEEMNQQLEDLTARADKLLRRVETLEKIYLAEQ